MRSVHSYGGKPLHELSRDEVEQLCNDLQNLGLKEEAYLVAKEVFELTHNQLDLIRFAWQSWSTARYEAALDLTNRLSEESIAQKLLLSASISAALGKREEAFEYLRTLDGKGTREDLLLARLYVYSQLQERSSLGAVCLNALELDLWDQTLLQAILSAGVQLDDPEILSKALAHVSMSNESPLVNTGRLIVAHSNKSIDGARQIAEKLMNGPELDGHQAFALAYFLRSEGCWSRAQTYFELCSRKLPASGAPLLYLAEVEVRRFRPRAAIEHAREGLTLSPHSKLGLGVLFRANLMLGRVREAIKIFRRIRQST